MRASGVSSRTCVREARRGERDAGEERRGDANARELNCALVDNRPRARCVGIACVVATRRRGRWWSTRRRRCSQHHRVSPLTLLKLCLRDDDGASNKMRECLSSIKSLFSKASRPLLAHTKSTGLGRRRSRLLRARVRLVVVFSGPGAQCCEDETMPFVVQKKCFITKRKGNKKKRDPSSTLFF